MSRKLKFHENVTRMTGALHEGLFIFMILVVKGKGHPITGHEGPRGGVEV
jgi:hypothetical protein